MALSLKRLADRVCYAFSTHNDLPHGKDPGFSPPALLGVKLVREILELELGERLDRLAVLEASPVPEPEPVLDKDEMRRARWAIRGLGVRMRGHLPEHAAKRNDLICDYLETLPEKKRWELLRDETTTAIEMKAEKFFKRGYEEIPWDKKHSSVELMTDLDSAEKKILRELSGEITPEDMRAFQKVFLDFHKFCQESGAYAYLKEQLGKKKAEYKAMCPLKKQAPKKKPVTKKRRSRGSHS